MTYRDLHRTVPIPLRQTHGIHSGRLAAKLTVLLAATFVVMSAISIGHNPIHRSAAELPREIVTMEFPTYPDLAVRARATARILVSYVVEMDGNVQEIHIIGGGHPLLNDAIYGSLRKWKFAPSVSVDSGAATFNFNIVEPRLGEKRSDEIVLRNKNVIEVIHVAGAVHHSIDPVPPKPPR